MRTLLLSAAVASTLIFASCKKIRDLLSDVPLPPGVDTSKYHPKDTVCGVSSQTGGTIFSINNLDFVNHLRESIGNGFIKTYSPITGKVEKVEMATLFWRQGDSATFHLTYDGNVVHVNELLRRYAYRPKPNGQAGYDLVKTSEETFVFDITLNAKKQVTILGLFSPMHFYYDANGLLTHSSYSTSSSGDTAITFEYDEQQNITKVEVDHYNTIAYEHDLTQTANNQLYITSAFSIYPDLSNRYAYNLLEIMGWIPIQHKNLCTKSIIKYWLHEPDLFGNVNEYRILQTLAFSNHVIDEKGSLVAFTLNGTNYDDEHLPEVTVNNTIHCGVQ